MKKHVRKCLWVQKYRVTHLHRFLKDRHHHYGLLKAILFSSRSNSSNKAKPLYLVLQNYGLHVQSFNISLPIQVVSSSYVPHPLHSYCSIVYYLEVIFLQDSLYPWYPGKGWKFTWQSKSCNQESIWTKVLQVVVFFSIFTLKVWPEIPSIFHNHQLHIWLASNLWRCSKSNYITY